jgi:uncharacterized protein HemX
MSEVTTVSPSPEAATPAPPPPAPPAPPAAPEAAPARSRAWLGVLAAFVAMALLAGATAVLFVRVQEADDRADEAVTIASNQDVLEARIASLDQSLAALESSGTTTADDVAAVGDQVSSLRRCLNNALDAFAQATQSGKPVSINKC